MHKSVARRLKFMHKNVVNELKFMHKNVVNELKFVHKNVNNGKIWGYGKCTCQRDSYRK